MGRIVGLAGAAAITLLLPKLAQADELSPPGNALGFAVGPVRPTVPLSPRHAEVCRYRNCTMCTAGIFLMGAGGAATFLGGLLIPLSAASGADSFGIHFCGGVLGIGLALPLIGVPLFLVGSQPPSTAELYAPRTGPRLEVGATGPRLVF
jgi:hypothetical protein